MRQQKLLGADQDGSRECTTCIATICANGSSLAPVLIYKAASGDLQHSWPQDYDPQERTCWFASSPDGWTSIELASSWLQSLFDKQTTSKAGKDWRLLILNGRGSNCTLSFLEWCRSHKILVAVFPSHSKHRPQPLDASLFGSLATYYSQELDTHSRLSQGIASVTKPDFYKNFYSAFDKAFTEANVSSGWRKTGIEPFESRQVLKISDEQRGDHSEASQVEVVPSRHSSSCLDTPWAHRAIRRTVNEAVAERDAGTVKIIRKLGGACITLSAKLRLAEDREKGYVEAFNGGEKKRKREQPFTEELRADEGIGALFFSPSKIRRARELQDAKEAAKEREALKKVYRAEARAAAKVQKELKLNESVKSELRVLKQGRPSTLPRRPKGSKPGRPRKLKSSCK